MGSSPSSEELIRLEAMSVFEKGLRLKGFQRIAGIDEAGRGPLAGPVVAAACILPEGALFEGLNDSKQVSLKERERLFDEIVCYEGLAFGIGIVDEKTIDEINILQATLLAMKRAVKALAVKPDYLLIDGNRPPSIRIPKECVVKGDSLSISIAAASVIAKVTRDRILDEYDRQWPEYGFQHHKGYGTEFHLEALQRWGPCPIHRKSFSPMRQNG